MEESDERTKASSVSEQHRPAIPPPVYVPPQKVEDSSGIDTANNNNMEDITLNQSYQQAQYGYYSGKPPVQQQIDEKDEDNNSTYEEAFPIVKQKSILNDWPFILVFLATLGGFIVIASLTLRGWSHTSSDNGSGIYTSKVTGSPNTNAVIMLIFTCAIAFSLALVGLILCRFYPKVFIITGMIVNIFACLGTAIMYMSLHYWSAGIVFLVFTLFTAFCYWGMRKRIPLSVAIIKIIINAMKVCHQTLFIGFGGAIVASAFGILFSTVVVATYMKYNPTSENGGCDVTGGGCSHAKVIGILVAVFFCGYYITEVIRNVMHVSVSGVFGSWYYRYKSDQGMPKWPAFGALKRALTVSFGSICFGSLIVAIIDTMHQFLNLVRQSLRQNNQRGNWASIILLLLNWMTVFLKWLAQYFNHYAYCFIALYGKPYLEAAKDTWSMMKEKGIDALINDSLINTALGFYALFVSYISTLFAFLYLRFTSPAYNSTGAFNASLMAFAFVISLQICNITSEVIKSGVATFFIALGNDPEIFQACYPTEFDEIFRAYPEVLQKLTQNPHVPS